MTQKLLTCVVVVILTVGQLAEAADLSPDSWPAAERARLEKLEGNLSPLASRAVEGRSGLIAGTMSPVSVNAGLEALRQGGTAADAAATVALTQVTMALGSYVSFAGILRLVYYDAKSKRVYSLNAPWKSYAAERDPRTIPVDDLGPLPNMPRPTEGAPGRKTLVPGFMAGIEAMHKRFGLLPFRDLFTPAIWYAEHGVRLKPSLAGAFFIRRKYLSRTESGLKFMAQGGGKFPVTGSTFIQADLANTLRAVARNGARYMYKGKWARDFVDAVQAAGGKASLADLASYRPVWEDPLSSDFLGNRVFSAGQTSDGACQILETLNLAEALNLQAAGPYYKDARAMKDLARAIQLAETERFDVPQISKFKRLHGIGSTVADRITKEHARVLAPLVDPGLGVSAEETTFAGQKAPHHSDSIVVVDRWGNVAALVHSINTFSWGTTGIVVGGIPISDPAGFQQSMLASVKPGSLIPNDMAPVVVLKSGSPVLAVGTIGESLVPETVRILMCQLANHIDLTTLMAAPPLLANFEPWRSGETLARRAVVIPPAAYDQRFLRALAAAGVMIEQKSKFEATAIKGTAAVVTIDGLIGVRHSAETPDVWDFAAGY